MQQDIEISSDDQLTLSWSEVWIRALTQPSATTYETLLQDPQASGKRGYKWMAISAIVGLVVSTLFATALSMIFALDSTGTMPEVLGGALGAIVCGGPVIAALAVLGVAMGAGLSNAVARMMGGAGVYDDLVYLMCAYNAPLSLISSVLTALPVVGPYLAYIPIIYSFVLNIIAIKASHKFKWWKAFVAGVAIYIIIMVIIAAIVFMILVLLGPAIEEIFNQIMMEM
jgi:hypothetical protein